MSILRFVLGKINVIYNSLIKFCLVRKSNDGPSFTCGIAQTKTKLQLNETGSILSRLFWIIFLCCLLIGILVFLLLIYYYGFSIEVTVTSVVVVVVPPAVIELITKFIKYKMRWEQFASKEFRFLGKIVIVEFGHRNTNGARNSEVVQEIKSYFDSNLSISLNPRNPNCDLFEEICEEICNNTIVSDYYLYERNDFTIMMFDNTVPIRFDVRD